MFKQLIHLQVLIAVVALLPSTLQADVFQYGIRKNIYHTQDSNAQPVTATSWNISALLFTDVDNEVTSATLSWDRPPPQLYALPQQGTTVYGFGVGFLSEAAMDADFPSTTYTFTVDRGSGPETGDLFLADGFYTSDIPWFTGDTYDRLQVYDAAVQFDGTINGFTPHPGTNFAGASLAIYDEVGVPVFTLSLGPSDTTFTVPAGTLEPDSAYWIYIDYGNFVFVEDAGFSGADAYAGFDRAAFIAFTTNAIPEPGAVTLLGLGGLLALIRRRRGPSGLAS